MHSIVYDNAQSDWNEALPLGNGVFGGMAFFKENTFTMALNHYEVYYTIHSRYSKAYQEKLENGEISFASPNYSYEDCVKAAMANTRDYNEKAYIHYRKTIWPTADLTRDVGLHKGESHPPTGEISLKLSEKLKNADDYSLRLDIETAKTVLSSKKNDSSVKIENLILTDCDCSLMNISQSKSGLIETLKLNYPQNRNHKDFTYEWHSVGDDTFYYTVSFFPQGEDKDKYEPFKFAVATKLINAKGVAVINDNNMEIAINADEKDFSVLTHVLTELKSNSLVADILKKLDETANKLKEQEKAHQNYWKHYFAKSNINIPDKFLERLWYLNLYALGCASGRNGKRFEQASGLNGLWDIKQPTIWGSLWYWDVNIQSSYWNVYTSNHMELAEVFNEGFLSYSKMAAKRANEYYGMKGYAIDYPHTFYNCMWPWCAQYLWWYYEYTLDNNFLREKAYPMFKNQIEFINDVAQFDEEKQEYYFFPDVSPEQGPITRNSTITIATVKYLLEMAIKSNEILDNSKEDKAFFEKLLSKMPQYCIERLDRYGEVIKDSELAPPAIRLRHPSLLMPIFPISEISMYSDEKQRKIAENTLFFVTENVEIGVFPFGWVSCAAARLGKGNTALRILYEQGIDLIFRANGMGAEETDCWVNHCAVESGQLYYPAMMECTGEIIACVNEMLLQSFDNIITVFPSLPNGDMEEYRDVHRQQEFGKAIDERKAANWQNCEFDKMRAKGAFEVSAKLKDGKVDFVKLSSLQGAKARLRIPQGMESFTLCNQSGNEIAFVCENGIISFDTEKGMEYLLSKAKASTAFESFDAQLLNLDLAPIDYVSHINRRVFAGKDKNTDTVRHLDSFLFDYYVANDRYHTVAPYKFSFGVDKDMLVTPVCNPKYEPQAEIERRFIKITPKILNCSDLGFGFDESSKLQAVDTNETNILFRDYISGEKTAIFSVELPKGRYDLLFISGASNGDFFTKIKLEGIEEVEILATNGKYCSKIIPIAHMNDGNIAIELSTEENRKWNLNLLVIRKLSSFM